MDGRRKNIRVRKGACGVAWLSGKPMCIAATFVSLAITSAMEEQKENSERHQGWSNGFPDGLKV